MANSKNLTQKAPPHRFKSIVEIIKQNIARGTKKANHLINQIGANISRYSEVVVKPDAIRKARIKEGMTQVSLAQAINKKTRSRIDPVNARKAISKYETGIRNPTLKKAEIIAGILKVPFNKLFYKGIRQDGLSPARKESIRARNYNNFQKIAHKVKAKA